MRTLFLLLLLSLNVVACGTGGKREERFRPTYESCLAQGMLYYGGGCYAGSGVAHAQGRFSLLNDASLLRKLNGGKISVCIADEALPASRTLEIQMDVEKAFKVWLHEIEDLLPNKTIALNFKTVTKDILPVADRLLTNLCDETQDIKIYVRQTIDLSGEDREYARPNLASIYLNKSSSAITILHEMGHLFGLSDIYIEDVWTCQEGFSNSIMCNSGWGKPVLDDIEAVRRAYCLVSDGLNTKCFNHVKGGLLTFLPSEVKRNGSITSGSYFACFSGTKYFTLGYSSVNFVEKVGQEFYRTGGEFYSTDDHSVRESFVSGDYIAQIQARLFDETSEKPSQNASSFRYTINKSSVSIEIPSKGISFTQAAYECTFDEKFLTYLEASGMDTAKIRARQSYNNLVHNTLEQRTEFSTSDKLKLTMLASIDEDISLAELKIFAGNEERTLLKSIPLNTLIYSRTGMELKFDFGDTLGLDAGTYFIHIDKVVSPHAELKLIVEKPSAL